MFFVSRIELYRDIIMMCQCVRVGLHLILLIYSVTALRYSARSNETSVFRIYLMRHASGQKAPNEASFIQFLQMRHATIQIFANGACYYSNTIEACYSNTSKEACNCSNISNETCCYSKASNEAYNWLRRCGCAVHLPTCVCAAR
jgi:hypothetical protein